MQSVTAVTVAAVREHTATVIFMHGLGDSGNGWRFLADECRRMRAFDHVKFIFPNAPIQKVSLNFGLEMPSWFDIISLDKVEEQEDQQGMLASSATLRSFISKEISGGIKPERIVIGGFSQGCAISLLTGLTSDIKLGGVVGLSGFIPMRSRITQMHQEHGITFPYFVGHGTLDPVVKFEYGMFTHTKLTELEIPHEFHEYKGLTHSTSPKELVDLLDFLKRTIPEKSD
ncbi:Phospholipase/carboxylesterase/thioesterase [Lipomyces oligophaga]|uniref:Phospholipase/carboxylesterase/thioesterase n=1 Tax=Lipomyces oligophaga TaxID=45792 RepID=UPI0034CF29CD